MFPFRIRLALATGLLLVTATLVAADETFPLEPADLSSPRGTLSSFVNNMNRLHRMLIDKKTRRAKTPEVERLIDKISSCIDFSQHSDYLREALAAEQSVCLKEVLDRIPMPSMHDVPDADTVEEEELTTWTIPHSEITLHRVESGPYKGNWQFSPETIAASPQFYERVKGLEYRNASSPGLYNWYLSRPGWLVAPLVDVLPQGAAHRIAGQAIWQWVGLVLAIAVALTIMFAAFMTGRVKAQGLLGKNNIVQYCLTLAFPLAAMLVPQCFKWFIRHQLAISGVTRTVCSFAADMAFLIGGMVVIVAVGNRVAEIIISSPRINPKGADAQFIRIVVRILSLVAATILFLEGGHHFGIPLTTLLASAGVGGLTVALAAQDMLKNLFGSMMIFFDKPYRVGERIAIKNYDGVVEEIGIRSTKIRLLTGNLVAIPNEQMARIDIENIGRRPHIRRVADLHIPLDTPPAKCDEAVQIVRDILENHDGMDPEFPPRVYQHEVTRDSLSIRIIYWFHPPEYWEFMEFGERVNREIMERFQAAGIRFAWPTSATRMSAEDHLPLPLEVIQPKAT